VREKNRLARNKEFRERSEWTTGILFASYGAINVPCAGIRLFILLIFEFLVEAEETLGVGDFLGAFMFVLWLECYRRRYLFNVTLIFSFTESVALGSAYREKTTSHVGLSRLPR